MIKAPQDKQIDVMSLDIRKRRNFTQPQINMLIKLVEKFGQDFKYISMVLKKKFNNNFLFPFNCKNLWERYCKLHNWDWLTKEEFEDVYIRYKLCILKEKCGIWKKMTRYIDRPEDSIKTRFFLALKRTIVQLIYFYADNTIKPFYYVRINCFNTCAFTTLIYVSQYKPTAYDLLCEEFVLIWEGCKTFIKWMEVIIKLELYNHKDYKYFLNAKLHEQIPQISQQQFETVMELVLLLETLNRILLSQTPYEDHYAARKPKVEYGSDDSDEESEDVSIPERLVYVPYDLNRKDQNRTSNPEKFITKKKPYKGYKFMPKLTTKQKQIVLNTELAFRLLPILCKVINIIVLNNIYPLNDQHFKAFQFKYCQTFLFLNIYFKMWNY